jgi:hypothetical protein
MKTFNYIALREIAEAVTIRYTHLFAQASRVCVLLCRDQSPHSLCNAATLGCSSIRGYCEVLPFHQTMISICCRFVGSEMPMPFQIFSMASSFSAAIGEKKKV